MRTKVHPTCKMKNRVANWPSYNEALVRRGDVTFWSAPEVIAGWTLRRSGMRGGQRRYSKLAIEAALTLRLIYHLPLRRAESFVYLLLAMMELDLPALPITRGSPDAVSICRAVFDRSRPAKASGYHRWARVENAFFRYKSIIGDGLRARSPAGQGSEAVIGCNIVNRMTDPGRSASHSIGR